MAASTVFRTDSIIQQLVARKKNVKRAPWKRYDEIYTVETMLPPPPYQIMIWGEISCHGTTELYFLASNTTLMGLDNWICQKRSQTRICKFMKAKFSCTMKLHATNPKLLVNSSGNQINTRMQCKQPRLKPYRKLVVHSEGQISRQATRQPPSVLKSTASYQGVMGGRSESRIQFNSHEQYAVIYPSCY